MFTLPRLLAPLIAVLMLTSTAFPCGRCGLFGNRCRFASHAVHHAPAVVAVAEQPATVVITNVYPNPIAAQGGTVYGYSDSAPYSYQAAAFGHQVNPDRFLAIAESYLKTGQQLAGDGFGQFQATTSSIIAQQVAGNIEVEKIRAAAQVLESARSPATAPQTFSFQATVQGGKVSIQETPADEGGAIALSLPAPEFATLITAKCASCHNPAKAKGGLDLSAPQALSLAELDNISASVTTADPAKRMPRNGDQPGTLTPQEIAVILLRAEQLRRAGD